MMLTGRSMEAIINSNRNRISFGSAHPGVDEWPLQDMNLDIDASVFYDKNIPV